MPKLHSHSCEFADKGCTNKVPCNGELLRNFDGWPEVICLIYDRQGDAIGDMACEECADSYCADCGAVTRFEEHQ